MKHEIALAPKFFGPGLQSIIEQRLHQEVEGTCNGRYGYILSVVNIEQIERGLIDDTYGSAKFTVRYKAVVLKPFKNEVLDAVVDSVNKVRACPSAFCQGISCRVQGS